MLGGNLQLVVYALVATLSPLAFAATLAVIETGRLRALAFGVGFVGAQLATVGVLVLVGTAAVPGRERARPTLRAALELAVGLALLALAGLVRRRHESLAPRGGDRTRAALDRLRQLHGAAVLAGGVLLGIGGPKRLVLTALAATTIGASGSGAAADVGMLLGYSALATLLVWAPVAAFELVGDRVLVRLHAAQSWLGRRQRGATFWSLLFVGSFAAADALVSLL